jgi:hypothetical protein
MFQRLQWGGCTVVRTRDPNRFGRALALHFSGHGPSPIGLLRTDGVVAIHDGRATVLPASFRQQIPNYERPLRDAGVVLHDSPWVDFDPGTGDVAVERPRLATGCFDALVTRLPAARRPDPTAEYGRYPLAGWYFESRASEQGPMSIIDAVATVLSGLRSPVVEENQLSAVTTMLGATPFGRLPLGSASDIVAQMRP